MVASIGTFWCFVILRFETHIDSSRVIADDRLIDVIAGTMAIETVEKVIFVLIAIADSLLKRCPTSHR